MVVKTDKVSLIEEAGEMKPKHEEKDFVIACIDRVIEREPTLALRFSIIAEKVNKEFSLSLTADNIENYYYDSLIFPKLTGGALDVYLQYKHAGLV